MLTVSVHLGTEDDEQKGEAAEAHAPGSSTKAEDVLASPTKAGDVLASPAKAGVQSEADATQPLDLE